MKNVLIATIGILISLSIFTLMSVSRNPQKQESQSTEKITPLKTASQEGKLQTYADPSGFTFQYPEGITVTDKNSPTSPLYSSLEIITKGEIEKIIIKVEDSDLITIDDWFKESKKSSVFGEVKKIKLSDLDARQFEANNMLNTIALDQSVLFTLTTTAKKGGTLAKTYDKIINSFKLVQPSPSVQNSSSNFSDYSSDVIDEGEEVEEVIE